MNKLSLFNYSSFVLIIFSFFIFDFYITLSFAESIRSYLIIGLYAIYLLIFIWLSNRENPFITFSTVMNTIVAGFITICAFGTAISVYSKSVIPTTFGVFSYMLYHVLVPTTMVLFLLSFVIFILGVNFKKINLRKLSLFNFLSLSSIIVSFLVIGLYINSRSRTFMVSYLFIMFYFLYLIFYMFFTKKENIFVYVSTIFNCVTAILLLLFLAPIIITPTLGSTSPYLIFFFIIQILCFLSYFVSLLFFIIGLVNEI